MTDLRSRLAPLPWSLAAGGEKNRAALISGFRGEVSGPRCVRTEVAATFWITEDDMMRLEPHAPVANSRCWLAAMWSLATLVVAGCNDPASVDAPVRGPVSAAVVPTTGLVGEWKLDESSGTTAFDTKNGFNASVAGGAAFVGGHLGNALNLNNGVSGTGGKYAQMPSNATLDGVQEGNYTISAWFNATTVPTDDSLPNRYWGIVAKPGQTMGLVFNWAGKFSMRHFLADQSLLITQGNTIYAAGGWHHVVGAVSKSGGTVKVYVDGALKATTTFPAGTAAWEYGTTPFRIGTAQVGTWAANGKVDQVRIYNRELSASEVADLFNETTGAPPTVTTSAASPVGNTTATLRGSANPNGSSTTGWFRYSKTDPGSCNDSFGTRTPSTGGSSLGSGTSAVAFSRALTGLTAATTYYFCALASNTQGTGVGGVQFVTMASAPSGIPFGLSGINPDTMPSGTIWTEASLSSKNVTSLVHALQSAEALTPKIRMWFYMTGGNEQDFMNPDSSFNLQRWKDTLDKYAAPIQPDGTSGHYLEVKPYIENGTFLGIVMLDDLQNFTPDPTFAEIEAMAAHAKLRYPGLLTAVRLQASNLKVTSGGAPYAQLDVAWSQFRIERGQASTYRDTEIQAAQDVKLGLVLGINITQGGGSLTEVRPDSLLSWGTEFLKPGSSDYVCAFNMWDKTYSNLTHPNMTTLANKAASHVTSTCKRRP
jgi:hypothetical protein